MTPAEELAHFAQYADVRHTTDVYDRFHWSPFIKQFWDELVGSEGGRRREAHYAAEVSMYHAPHPEHLVPSTRPLPPLGRF
jgi:hypothetical protein